MTVYNNLSNMLAHESLILQGIPPFGFFLTNIPESQNLLSPEPESNDKIEVIRQLRNNIKQAQLPLISVANRFQDILPTNILKPGAARSQAVCRISQYFSLEDFKKFIVGIKNKIEEKKSEFDINENFNSSDKLKEIFLIPEELSKDIFGRKELPLDALLEITVDELAQINPIPRGTGFLVGGTYLLTNNHIIQDAKTSAQCVAQFNYIEDDLGNLQKSIDYEFDPKLLFITEPSLDYTLIQLKSNFSQKSAGYEFGWIQLVEDDEAVLPGDNVIIVHHPKGWTRKLDITNNSVLVKGDLYKEDGLYKEVLRYTADTDYGSSGSPVFNTNWQLVALHHAAIPKNTSLEKQDNAEENQLSEIIIQQGVRICKIVEDMKKKSYSNAKLRSFIEDFVVISEQLNCPPFPSGIVLNGLDSYINTDITRERFSFANNESFTIEAWINPHSDGTGRSIISNLITCQVTERYEVVVIENSNNYQNQKDLMKNELRGECALFIANDGKLVFSKNLAEPIFQSHASRMDTPLVPPPFAPGLPGAPLPGGGFARDIYEKGFLIGREEIQTKKTLLFNKFSHIAVTYDGKSVKFYIDGYFDSEHSFDKKCKSFDEKCKGDQKNLLIIGASWYQKKPLVEKTQCDFFKGIISEFRIWKVCRSQDQIKTNMYRLKDSRDGLVGYWQFEEGEGNKTNNLASKEDCEAFNIDWFRASQYPALPLPLGLKFNKKDDHVDCGNDEKLKIANAITVEAWVKHRFGNCLIVHRSQQSQSGSSGEPRSWGYFLVWHNGKIRVILQDESFAQKIIVETTEKAPQDRLWHHFAFTWDSNSSTKDSNLLSLISIYIDGRLQDSVVIEGQSKTITSVTGKSQTYGIFKDSFNNLTSPLKIGCREKQEAYCNVMISDVRLWNVSRPQDQIKGNINQRLKGNEEGLVGYWRLDDGGENNQVARNLVSDKNPGNIIGTTWFSALQLENLENQNEN